MSAVFKALRPWEVWDDASCRHFATLAGAEKYARRQVASIGRPVEIWHQDQGQMVACVRADALGRVWTDVVDCTAL